MSRRPPLPPPVLRGYEFLRVLGSGGSSDVYLFRQHVPHRVVAVKVLLPADAAVRPRTAESLLREADLMAISSHPSIVTVHDAGVTDDGREYLVMEYCSRGNLQLKLYRSPLTQIDILRIGVQLSGAVESVHRGGVRHGDIKPSNVLITDYDRPALSDFGAADMTQGDVMGMSIPWAPPEFFEPEPRASYLSDIYSLGATLHSIAAGRSPFEVVGGDNSSIALIERIRAGRTTPIERADLDDRLVALFDRAMARDPEDRFAHAVDLGRELQRLQISLGVPVTPIDVLDTLGDTVVPSAIWADEPEGVTHERLQGPGFLPPADPLDTVPPGYRDALYGETVIVGRGAATPKELGITARLLSRPATPYDLVADEVSAQRPFSRQVDYTTFFGGFVVRSESSAARRSE